MVAEQLNTCLGSIILVLGLMDDNGYYTAVYQNSKGIIPANFVQEIEVRDEDLMTRLANQVKAACHISELK